MQFMINTFLTVVFYILIQTDKEAAFKKICSLLLFRISGLRNWKSSYYFNHVTRNTE